MIRTGNIWSTIYFALASLALLAVAFAWSSPKPPKVEPVLHPDTFEQRFRDDSVPVTRVRTVSIVRPRDIEPQFDIVRVLQTAPLPQAPVAQAVAVPRRTTADICIKHGRRKVMVSRYRWKCR